MQTLFYFNDVTQLADFESFEVKPVSDHHAEAPESTGTPQFWSVIGTLREEKVQNLQHRQFPVADLPSEQYAGLFATLCKQLTGNH